MQSTIQFGKDVNALKIGHISKSPDPILVGAGKDHSQTNPYGSDKSQVSIINDEKTGSKYVKRGDKYKIDVE